MNFVLIDLLVMKRALPQHVVAELCDCQRTKPVECGDGSVGRGPIRNGAAWHGNAMLRRDATRRFFLRVTKVIEAQCSRDEAWRIFHPFEASEG